MSRQTYQTTVRTNPPIPSPRPEYPISSGLQRLHKVLTSASLLVLALALSISAVHAQDSEPVPTLFHEEDPETVFRDQISGPIVQSKCIYCHVEGGRSGHTRLVFVRTADTSDHEALNLSAFADFLDTVAGGHERILTKIQGVAHGGGPQAPVGSTEFAAMDRFLALLVDGDHPRRFVLRILERLSDGQASVLFGITTPADGDAVAGNAVTVSATGAPTETVHFAYRPTELPEEEFAYLGAAANHAATARFAWNTPDLPDGAYELVTLFTEDEGASVVYDAIAVRVDNAAPAVTLDIVENIGRKTQALRRDAAYEVVTADGVMVTLPPGALDDDDRLTIEVTDPPDPATAPGDAVGTGIDVTLASGQDTFGAAVTIALPYPEGKPDGLVDHTDIPETGLSLWFFDPQADAWALLPGSRVQPDADLVVAEVRQTGQFGIFNAPLLRLEQDGEAVTGLDFGTAATAMPFAVVNGNAASQPLTWAIDPPAPSWLAVSETRDAVTVSVDRTGLESGDYSATLSITSNGGTREVSVSMRVPAAPGGGGCAAFPVLPGTPPDPTLMGLLALATLYLMLGRRRPRHRAVMG